MSLIKVGSVLTTASYVFRVEMYHIDQHNTTRQKNCSITFLIHCLHFNISLFKINSLPARKPWHQILLRFQFATNSHWNMTCMLEFTSWTEKKMEQTSVGWKMNMSRALGVILIYTCMVLSFNRNIDKQHCIFLHITILSARPRKF